MRDKVLDGVKLFLKSHTHRDNYTLQDIDTFLLTPLRHGKLKVFYEAGKPVGLVSWSFLNSSQEREYLDTGLIDKSVFSSTEGTLWCLDLISAGKTPREMVSYLRRLKKKLYPDYSSSIKFIRFSPDLKEHKARL